MRETVAPLEPEFAEDAVVYEHDSPDALAMFFFENFADYRAMLVEVNEASDGTMKATADYLVTIVKP